MSVEDDLNLTLRELSETYEELSLIYRLTEKLAGSTADEICESVLDEVTGVCDTCAAAILFPDAQGETFYTKSCRGDWDAGRRFGREAAFLWSSVEGPPACRRAGDESKEHVPLHGDVYVCPLAGKKKAVGVLLIVSACGREFYSGIMKLLHAIASQAALFIENSLLYEEMEEIFLGTIGSYVTALEAASGWTSGHTERVTECALGIGEELGLDAHSIERLRISSLLHDIGKITVRSEVLEKKGVLFEEEWEEIRKHPGTGAEILGRIKAFADIAEAVRCHHERWDGSGTLGLRGEQIPEFSRILSVADAYDAMTSERPYRPGMPPEKALREIMENSGRQFDPEVVTALVESIRKGSGR